LLANVSLDAAGAVSLEYHLSQQPLFGNWTIKVVAQGQEETKDFLVEEYCEFVVIALSFLLFLFRLLPNAALMSTCSHERPE
jgi:hypothetical protein